MAFHLHRDGKAVEFALDDLRAMARKGELRQDEYVYDDVKAEWIGAALVPELEGAWDLEESESTVAMELPPDFFEKFDEEEKRAKEASAVDAPTTKDAPPPAAPAPSPAPAADDGDEATRAMDLSELEGAMAPSTQQQQEATVAIDVTDYDASNLGPNARPQPPKAEPAPQRPQPQRPQPQRPQPAPQPQRPQSQRVAAAARQTSAAPKRPVNRTLGKDVSPVVAALLSFFTCGIYTLVWIWKRSEETNKFLGKEVLPRWFVPAIIGAWIVFGGGVGVLTMGAGTLVGWFPGMIITAVWGYKFGECVNEMSQQSRLNVGDRKVVYALCALFAPVLLFLGQQDLNEIWEANGAMKR